jgi:hypothetical protein
MTPFTISGPNIPNNYHFVIDEINAKPFLTPKFVEEKLIFISSYDRRTMVL